MDETVEMGDPTGLARSYVRLALRLDRVVPGLVDAHLSGGPVPDDPAGPATGPSTTIDVAADAGALGREADRLRAALPDAGLGPRRTAVLDGQLRALRTVADRAAGVRVDVVDEVAHCLGVRVAPGDEDRYREAHRALDDLLPGRGPLGPRLVEHRRRDRVPAEVLAPAVTALAAALRERTAAVLGLPPGERVGVEVVDDAAWSGFTRRTGPLTSTVTVNAAVPHRVAHLARLVAHEAYPGHHTDSARVEAALAAGTGAPERSVQVARTPQSLLAEGTAELGLEVVVGPGWGTWAAEVLAPVLARAGRRVAPADAALAEAVEDVMERLAPVRQDAMLLVHAGPGTGAPTAADAAERAVAHLRRWLFVDEDRARRMLEFVAHPRWRIHTTTYVEGVRLLRPFLADGPGAGAGSVTDRFVRLLDEPWTPAMLAAATDPPAAAG